MSSLLSGKIVVITGASSGIGKGVALRVAQLGGSVVIGARRAGLLETIAVECESEEALAFPIGMDVSNRDDVERVAQETIATFGRIDVWINNAGVAAIGRFEETPLDDHVKVVSTDLLGTIYGSFFAMQQFRRQSFGTLINVASIVGKLPVPYYASYTAAKFGIVGLSGALRQELVQNGDQGIHVCTVLPSATNTPFFEHASNYTGHEATPLPPICDPATVVDVIVDLISHPQDEVIVGIGGKLADLAHHVFPGLVEDSIGRQLQRAQIDLARASEMTRGAVMNPVSEGIDVTATGGTPANAKKNG